MTRPETIKFEFRKYQGGLQSFENDLVAKLPGLLITQFIVPQTTLPCFADDSIALRFDFVEDWYSVTAYLDSERLPTGHYRVAIQSPLKSEYGLWTGDDLLLRLDVYPDFHYAITGEEKFFSAVEEGWMRVYSAAKAREALRGLCAMVDGGSLPQEVMDAVHG